MRGGVFVVPIRTIYVQNTLLDIGTFSITLNSGQKLPFYDFRFQRCGRKSKNLGSWPLLDLLWFWMVNIFLMLRQNIFKHSLINMWPYNTLGVNINDRCFQFKFVGTLFVHYFLCDADFFVYFARFFKI